MKSFQFVPLDDEVGEIRIEGQDQDGSNFDHCISAGLLLHCQASDTKSPWHNFKSDLKNWKAEDGSPLCSNDGGMLNPQYNNITFIRSMVQAGSKKIWTSEREVALAGRPAN